ncbi:MAG: MBL fold metallo-hydrolase [Candidatus Zixiibacteriota bacterium]|nr:MAG: MBL fold metallo-hydrolase [candidate division Zixibacteria bacterium]
MTLKTLVVGPFQVNCYLYWDETSGDGLIIDPGAEETLIIDSVSRAGFKPRAILLTHGHADHIAAVAPVKGEYNVPLYVGDGEQDLLSNPSANVSAFFADPIVAPPADFLLTDEQVVDIGSVSLRVLKTPGHSPGGVCYLDESKGILFCGDTIFYGSIGRTDFPGCSHQALIKSINDKIMKLPDDVICYPGHGPETSVGNERMNNPFLRGDYFV